jgi:hypothetical protein
LSIRLYHSLESGQWWVPHKDWIWCYTC